VAFSASWRENKKRNRIMSVVLLIFITPEYFCLFTT
jgi:hypothetical protein